MKRKKLPSNKIKPASSNDVESLNGAR